MPAAIEGDDFSDDDKATDRPRNWTGHANHVEDSDSAAGSDD